MPEHNATDFRPAPTGLVGNTLKTDFDLLGPSLVIDVGDTRRTIGIVTHQPTEDHDCTATGKGHPVSGLPDINRLSGQRDPVVGRRRSKSHGCSS
jgi:hypothetical protein